MANGYTAVPSIIPGNLTVQGTLTLSNDGGIRIGAGAPFVRLYKRGAGGMGLSYNLGVDDLSRDLSAPPIWGLLTDPNNTTYFTKHAGNAAAGYVSVPDETIAQDGVNVSHTGDTVETTL